MKFTDEQIEDFRYDIGVTAARAKQAMEKIAEIVEAQIQTDRRLHIATEAMKVRYAKAIDMSFDGVNPALIVSQAFSMADVMLEAFERP